jgi:multiple sugar transport system permease protein
MARPARPIRPARPARSRSSLRLLDAGAYVLLTLSAVVVLCPLLLSLLTSLRSPADLARVGVLRFPRELTLQNYVDLLTVNPGFRTAIWVTLLVTVVIVATQVTASVLAAYAFARIRFPGRELLFWTFLGTLMVPAIVTMIPLYLMFARAHLINTFWGITLPTMLASPYAVFLLRQHFLRVPRDVLDAARIDGAGHGRLLWTIVVPLSRPIITTLAVITIVAHWNSFLWPLIVTNGADWQLLTVATANLQSQYSANWTLVTAATTVSLLPLIALFIVFQRHITDSLAIQGTD